MPSYKLIYFNGRGRAELIRFLFAQAGVEYEDCRVTGEEFAKLKPSLPTGSLPVLEVDGDRLTGSSPIAWYLASEFGLAGSNNLENSKIGAILDVVGDLQAKLLAARFGDEESKAKGKKDLEETHMPRYVCTLEKFIEKNGSADGWIFGNKPTIADFAICVLLDQALDSALSEKFPVVRKNINAVKALPKIAEWLKKRPETPF